MARRGFGAVKKVAQEHKERAKSYGDFARRFIIKDGETATVWFSGSRDEPYIGRRHYSSDIGYFVCGEERCVSCYAAGKGNKAHRKGSDFAAFNMVDTRLFHKIPTDKKDRHEFAECSDDKACKYCKRKVPRERAGRRMGEFSITWAGALGAQEAKINKKCASCFVGKIKVVDYQCPRCEESMDWSPEEGEEDEKIKCGS